MFQSTRKALLTATAVGALTLSGAAFAEGQFSYSDDANRVGATNLESAPVDNAPGGPGMSASDSIGDVRQQSTGTDQLGATGESIDAQISSAERRMEGAEERLQRAEEHLQSAERDLQSTRMSDHGSASSRSSMDQGDTSDPSSGYPSVGPQAHSDVPSGYDPYAKGTIVNRPYANVPAQRYAYGPYAYESTAWPSPAPPLTSHDRSYLQEDIYGGGEDGEGGSDGGGDDGDGAGDSGDGDSG